MGMRNSRNRLKSFLKRIGVGPRGSKDLEYEEAFEAMDVILSGDYEPATLGAFLMAMRWKGPTAEELAAFADAFASRITRPEIRLDNVIDIGGAFDGKNRTLILSVPAALVAAGAGAGIVFVGADNVPPKRGVTPGAVLRALGIETRRKLASSAVDISSCGVGFVDLAIACPVWKELLPIRDAVVKRTFLNTIEPLLNPLGVSVHFGSVFHRPFGERVCEAAGSARRLGFERVVIAEGVEGATEIGGGVTRFYEKAMNGIRTYDIDLRELGIAARTEEIRSSAVTMEQLSSESARSTELLLTGGTVSEAYRDLVLANAAVLLHVGRIVSGWEEGLELARASLTSGAAWTALSEWRRRGREE
ncbi:MAG: hypothetical protein D6679_02270 [Candidatus Hydrogenedentota bacterium]|nr:MAG: hypothetical protein D6679_02270 [Candidatus Hydrogenedentota bacterium]